MSSRPDSRLSVDQMKTHRIAAPISTHHRAAKCSEVECEAFKHGWVTSIDESTDLGNRQAGYIRSGNSGRHFTESRLSGGLVSFTFPSGQECFAAHTVSLERNPLFVAYSGDHRGRVGGVTKFSSADSWMDHLHSETAPFLDAIERG